jgi:hypothetical protein
METPPFRRIGMQLLALGIPLTGVQPAYGILAFARKYGLPCSACHQASPMLNNLGQTFMNLRNHRPVLTQSPRGRRS